MNEIEFETAPSPERPRTATVIGLLATTAAVLSYLGTYALSNALVAAEVLRPWPKDHDPRPIRFLIGFVVLIAIFSITGFVARFMSTRQMRQIEEMETEE
ncbi:MAG TPA: hypothetical protein VHD56_06925 [Tepidisphaeraceae bacterium]|nr:hypothetical protein [Tepidisphaeraceae bacterium]